MPLGVVMHFAVAIAWAFGYVYLVRTQPQLLSRPIVSGLGFGIVVYVFMQIVVLPRGCTIARRIRARCSRSCSRTSCSTGCPSR